MPLIIAQHAGFCMGVRNAVDKARQTTHTCRNAGIPCYSLGELINNPLVVDSLRAEGLLPVKTPEEAQAGALIIRSHGVSRAVLENARSNSAQVVDCTCPFVLKLHRQVENFSRNGAPVIIFGDPKHPEITGTMGWAKGEVYVVSTVEEVERLPGHLDGALLVSQTTFPPGKFDLLCRALLRRFPHLTVQNTICPATHKRQEEAARIAAMADVMIVIGGRGSANTQKLYETCRALCPRTFLVERAAELPSHLLHPARDIIGITAGASTPDWSLKEVVDSMNDIEMATPETQQEQQAPSSPEEIMAQAVEDFARIRNGQTVEGKIVQITDDEVCVNIGYKSDGLMKRADMVDKDVKLGDTVEVEVVKVNDGEGNVILSQRNIINKKLWDELMVKYENGEYVEAVAKDAVKGGLLCNVGGVRAFVPASQVANRYIDKLDQFVGQTLKLKIIEVDAAKKRIVASRKAVLAEEAARVKEEVFTKLEVGATVKGIVRRFASFGAFVDVGGMDGLIHLSDLSWARNVNPADLLTIGQEIDVVVLGLDAERERIQLGLKQLTAKPWDNVEEKYPVGTVITRTVVRIRPFGAFIELEPGVDGLCHISQVSHNRVAKIEEVLTPGQEVNVKILNVDPVAKRISLSIREALEDNAFDMSEEIPGVEFAEEAAAEVTEEAGEEV